MTTDQLEKFYDSVGALGQEGKTEEAKKMILDHFSELPESVQDEIMTAMFTDALRDEARICAAIRDIQDMGIKALKRAERKVA